MKKIFALAVMMMIFSLITVDAMGQSSYQRHRHRHHHYNNTGSVGAPLDGGLLTVLGAAGVAYVVARKKKRKTEE